MGSDVVAAAVVTWGYVLGLGVWALVGSWLDRRRVRRSFSNKVRG